MDTNRHEFIENDEIQMTNDELNPNDETTSRVARFCHLGFDIPSSFVIHASSLPRVFIRGYFAHLSRHMNHQPQIEKQKRRGKKQTVQKIQRTTDSR